MNVVVFVKLTTLVIKSMCHLFWGDEQVSNLNSKLRGRVSYPLDDRNVFHLTVQRYGTGFIT